MSKAQQQKSNMEIWDRPPSNDDLAEMLQYYKENDPRSALYSRVLIRPTIHWGKIFLFIVIAAIVCAATYVGAKYAFATSLYAVCCTMAIVCLIGILFAKQILITIIKIYQTVAPSKIRYRCRYEPSCSVFMIQAIEKYGVWCGLCKGIKRWQGCKPPNGGYDFP